MPRSSPVPGWVPSDLPTDPGVYRFADASGQVLYVGKSVNLRRRIRGYFYGGGPEGRMAEMLGLARALSFQTTGSDLEARLREARAILRRRPRFNRVMKNRWRGWYLEIDPATPYPRLRIVSRTRSPTARYFGPFPGRRLPLAIARLVEKSFRLRCCSDPILPDAAGSACLQYEIGMCSAPCIGAAGLNEYREQVREAVAALSDGLHARRARAGLLAERDRAKADLNFEAALATQRRVDWLDELESYREEIERPWTGTSCLVVLPHTDPDRRVLLPIALGRVLSIEDASWTGHAREEAIGDACYAIRVRELQTEPVLAPDEMVESLIVRRWLESGAVGGAAFDLSELDAPEILRQVS